MKQNLKTILLSTALTMSLILTPDMRATALDTTETTISTSGDPEASRHIDQNNDAITDTLWNANRRSKKFSQSENPYTGITYTHADAFDGKNIYNGIDVSKYQPTIDWNKVKADGIEFVFIRVGYRGYGVSGTLAADTCFEKHVTGALDAGLKVGLYYYTEAVNTEEAIEEAQYCIDKAKDYNITLPIVYDYETTVVGGVKTGRKYNAKLSKTAATKNCQAFCDTIQKAGYTPMVYANKSDLSTLINGATLAKSYKIWLANYTAKTTYSGTYEYWQYSSSGKINGISGKVDCNYWYSDSKITDNSNAVDLKNAVFPSVAVRTYTGSGITPEPKLTYNGKKLKKDVDYRLTYQNNKSVGTATITATGMGDYKGTKSTTFKIRPKTVTSFKMKAASKQITLSWAKNSLATGYQIYQTDTLSGTYKKVKTITSNATTTWKQSSLKENREYFYRIRAYTKVNGTNYYSAYTYLTAATLPGGKKAKISADTKLYEASGLTGTALVTIPKGAAITYVGRTYVTSGKSVYHIRYTKSSKTYEGYIKSSTKLTF